MNNYKIAVFDLDETLIMDKSLFKSFEYYCLKNNKYSLYQTCIRHLISIKSSGARREEVNKTFYEYFKGIELSQMKRSLKTWFEEVQCRGDFFINATYQRLLKHKDEGRKIIIVSGSYYECVEEINKFLKADKILAVNLAQDNGSYSGKIIGTQTIGKGKAEALLEFINSSNEYCLADSYGYGDDISDAAMMRVVDHPYVVCKKKDTNERVTQFLKKCIKVQALEY